MRNLWLRAGISLALCAAGRVGAESRTVVLRNNLNQLTFQVDGATVRLAGLQGNNHPWIDPAKPAPSLCVFTLQQMVGTQIRRVVVDTAQATAVETRLTKLKEGQALILRWSGIKPAGLDGQVEVEGTVTLRHDSPLSMWGLKVSVQVPGWGVESIQFPRTRIAADEKAALASPHGLGRFYRNPTKFESAMLGGASFGPEMGGTYPWALMTMQLMILEEGDTSLYVATHDPLGKGKFFHFAPAEDKAALDLWIEHYPEEPFRSGYKWTCSYESVLGTVKGDWWDACRIYRRWVLANAEWTRPPVGRAQGKLPDWWTRLALCDHSFYSRDVNGVRRSLPYILENQELMGGLPMFVLYPMWNTIGFDTGDPNFFPAHDWFVPDSQTARQHEAHFCPYINGINADVDSEYWRNGGSKNWVIMDPANTTLPTKGLQFMCPQSDWQQEIIQLAGRVARELQVDGIYFDVIACVPPVPCYSANHGHPIGNRSDLPLGIRRMMALARSEVAKINPDTIFSCEDSTECYGVEAPLVCNRTLSDMDCPMLMAVYSERIDPYGYNMTDEEYRKDPMSWRTKLAEEFVFGMKIGAMFPGKPGGKPDIITLQKDLAQARIAAFQYLSIGQMMHPPQLSGENPDIRTAWGDYGRADKVLVRPTVRASSWLASDGTAALAFVNVADEPVTIRWSVTAKGLGLNGGKCVVNEIYPGDASIKTNFMKGLLSGETAIPGLGSRIIRVSVSSSLLPWLRIRPKE